MNALKPGPYVAFTEPVRERITGFEVCTVMRTDADHHPALLAIAVDEPTAKLFAASITLLAAAELALHDGHHSRLCDEEGCVEHCRLYGLRAAVNLARGKS